MERLGGDLQVLSAEQKRQLSEVTAVYEARIAQARLRAEVDLQGAGADPEKEGKVRAALAAEVAQLEAQRDEKKAALRREFGG
jgi:F0F1-type ATP synthase membrane subunit b/b'